MTSFRKTLKKVFSKIKNLKASMVIGPSEVVNKEFDILIVDEAHRLKSRKNLSPGEYNTFDKNNEMLGIKNGNQLDWIFAKSTKQVLFYDENQSVRPSDINHLHFNKSHFIVHTLKSQLRVKGGNEYIEFISNVLSNKKPDFKEFKDYEFKIFDNLKEMVFLIKEKENQELKGKKQGLSRLLAGYAWDWTSKETKNAFDIVIKDVKLKWNSSNIDWVNSENATNEVGCIHTIQGYDLNYAGVIIGPELSYDFSTNSFIIYKDRYKDKKGKASIEDEETLKKYILNIYKVLLTRGIFGTFVYICDNNLRKYFQHVLESEKYSHEQQQVAMTERNRKYEK